MKPLRFIEHLNCLKSWRNKLNVGRAAIIHINLEGDDPSSRRPCSLYVVNKSNNPTKYQSLSFSTLVKLFKYIIQRNFIHLNLVIFESINSLIMFLQIAEKFARYGSVDVRTLSTNEALVAVSNHRT